MEATNPVVRFLSCSTCSKFGFIRLFISQDTITVVRWDMNGSHKESKHVQFLSWVVLCVLGSIMSSITLIYYYVAGIDKIGVEAMITLKHMTILQ